MALGQNYGTKTSSLMDSPLALRSVFAPYVGDNGYKFNDAGTIQVINTPDGSLTNYNEASVAPVSVGLVQNDLQTLSLAYNKAMFQRIQKTLIQDTPVANFAAKWAKQQIDDVFIPSHDIYSLNKVALGRATANDVEVTLVNSELPTSGLSKLFGKAFMNIRKNGAEARKSIAWVSDSFANELTDQITFTGSDIGYKDAKNSAFIGKHKGITCVAVPDDYFTVLGDNSRAVYVLMADKRAIINVTPKMSPEDYTVLTTMSGFSGVEVQMRDRSDTFVLGKKTGAIAVIRDAGLLTGA